MLDMLDKVYSAILSILRKMGFVPKMKKPYNALLYIWMTLLDVSLAEEPWQPSKLLGDSWKTLVYRNLYPKPVILAQG